MKKLVSMTMAMAMMAALFVACGDDGTDDETPPPAVPTIALDGGDIDQPQEITNPMAVKIGVTAPGAIAGFTVTIDSPALTAEMLATVGLATELNLVNPGSMAEALGALGFPSGEAVSGKTALTFDISKLVPMIAQIYNETSDHKFILKVTDAKGKSTTKTLTCHLTGKVALAYNNDADLWANTATVTAANVPDGGSVQYRVKGAADWTDAVLAWKRATCSSKVRNTASLRFTKRRKMRRDSMFIRLRPVRAFLPPRPTKFVSQKTGRPSTARSSLRRPGIRFPTATCRAGRRNR